MIDAARLIEKWSAKNAWPWIDAAQAAENCLWMGLRSPHKVSLFPETPGRVGAQVDTIDTTRETYASPEELRLGLWRTLARLQKSGLGRCACGKGILRRWGSELARCDACDRTERLTVAR